LPVNLGQLKKFVNLKKCNANQVDINGRLVCKDSKPVSVENDEVSFFSPSGNYKVEMTQTFSEDEGSMFLVKANPNGLDYKDEGSAVVGCYSPTSGLSFVKQFSGKPNDRGEKSYITCGTLVANGIAEDGIQIEGLGEDGIQIQGLGEDGIRIQGLGEDGIQIQGLGEDGIQIQGLGEDGIQIQGLGEDGIQIQGLGEDGIRIQGLGEDGIQIQGLGEDGIQIQGLAEDGIQIEGIGEGGIGGNGENGDGNGTGGNGNGNGTGDKNISNISEGEIFSGGKKNDQIINQTTKVFKSSDKKENIDSLIQDESLKDQLIDSVIPPWFR